MLLQRDESDADWQGDAEEKATKYAQELADLQIELATQKVGPSGACSHAMPAALCYTCMGLGTVILQYLFLKAGHVTQ